MMLTIPREIHLERLLQLQGESSLLCSSFDAATVCAEAATRRCARSLSLAVLSVGVRALPFWRRLVLLSLGGASHTISDFLDEWTDRMYLLRFTKHPYVLLHNQIVRDAAAKRLPEKPRRYPKKKRCHKN